MKSYAENLHINIITSINFFKHTNFYEYNTKKSYNSYKNFYVISFIEYEFYKLKKNCNNMINFTYVVSIHIKSKIYIIIIEIFNN